MLYKQMSKSTSFQRPQYFYLYRSDKIAKVLLIGNAGVGKSSILLQFSEKKFMHNYYNTIGVDYKIKYMKTHGKTIKLQIWDTAGQDRFRTITSSYYRGADAIAVVYDITDRKSFDNVKTWLDQIEKYASKQTVRYIVGNKSDLEEKRQVKYEQALQFAESIGLPFEQTSARCAPDVGRLFEAIVEKLGFLKFQQTKQTASRTQIDTCNLLATQQSQAANLKLQIRKSSEKQKDKCCSS